MQVYVGLLATFLLLWLPPALGEGEVGVKELGEEVGEVEEEELGVEELGEEEGKDGVEGREETVMGGGEEQCVQKVVMEVREVREEEVQCEVSVHRSCHTTYVTGQECCFLKQTTCLRIT